MTYFGRVRWQRWAEDGTPGRWSKTHLAADERGTAALCGAQAPADMCDGDDGFGYADCKRCTRIAAKQGGAR